MRSGGRQNGLPSQGATPQRRRIQPRSMAEPNRTGLKRRSGAAQGGVDRLGRRAERAPALSPRQACGTRHLARVPEIKRWVGACADAPHQTSLASPHQTSLTSPHAGLSPGSAAGGTARARARSSRPGLSPSGRLGSCTYCINGRDTAWGFQVKLRCQTGVL